MTNSGLTAARRAPCAGPSGGRPLRRTRRIVCLLPCCWLPGHHRGRQQRLWRQTERRSDPGLGLRVPRRREIVLLHRAVEHRHRALSIR